MKKFIKRISMIFRLIGDILYIPRWNSLKRKKRDEKLWIFSSWSGEKYNDNARIFYEYIIKKTKDIHCVWILQNQELIEKLKNNGIDAVNLKSALAKKYLKTAGKIFTVRDDEFDLRLINGAELYQLWHGMPLKKIKQDYAEGIKNYSNRTKEYKKIRDKLIKWLPHNYDNRFTTTNSDFFTPFLISSFCLPKERILNVGTPRCDALFNNKPESIIKRIRDKYKDCKIIIYMPTTRTSQWGGELFNPFISEYDYNESALEDVLEQKNLVFVFKPHFYDTAIVSEKDRFASRIIKVTDDDFDELYNFVGQTDILMTDYSSIYFDYLITRKPVILAPFDYEEYLKTSREHYFDYFTEMDGVKAKNWTEVLDILTNEKYRPVTEDKIKQFAEYADGKSCQKLFDMINRNLEEESK